MRHKILLGAMLLFLSFCTQSQNPFEMYRTKDKSWNASVFKLYIEQYAGLTVNQVMLDGSLSDIENELKEFPHTETEDLDEVINAVAAGQKAFLFIENAVWGGVEQGTTTSGSWAREMPIVSGFYIWDDAKCFEKEGINYHCGKKDKAHKTRFIIMN